MHLLGPAYTTTKTSKKKKRLPKTSYEADWIAYNKDMKRLGAKAKTLDEYISYREGTMPLKKKRTKDPMRVTSHRRESPSIPSGDGIGVSFASEPKIYTGTLIKGVATMHKSNSVPVTSQEQAEDIAKMRRS